MASEVKVEEDKKSGDLQGVEDAAITEVQEPSISLESILATFTACSQLYSVSGSRSGYLGVWEWPCFLSLIF